MKIQETGFENSQVKSQMKILDKPAFTSSTVHDEEKSNAAKLMIGATAVATVAALGIAAYKGKFGKGVQKFLGGAEKTVEKNTENATETVPKAVKTFESEFGGKRKLAYINPEYAKEFERLRKQGYKIDVIDLEDGYKKITYIYPQGSPIKTKVVYGKVADIGNGCDDFAYDVKTVDLILNDETSNVAGYSLTMRNNFKVSDGGRYEFAENRIDGGYGSTYGYLEPEDIFNKGVKKFINTHKHSKEIKKLLLDEFQIALGLK